MSPELIIDMWSRTNHQMPRVTLEDIIEMLATEIAKISDKLSEEELYRMIAVGALLYQRTHKEMGSVSADALFRKSTYRGGSA
ncbi:hypothetical protein HNR39_004429 [Glaciimonas immobilis]|uniref:Uncharacterized protein n=1 Tax=Glaciimonas immobilis TaxID=728004 RepID=A0A840S1J2_9BURK|nr:hypothetical protein [Glaciimonas immobilis]